jgi:alkanesulfonate monooxygenase SsuD/methylene tetrahydromethanopterin reductase-like flavin-dependent oxidoreductase (luciferase family)
MDYPPGVAPAWTRNLGTTDFQRIARTADELGYHAINVPEHIVMPRDLAGAMGTTWPHAMTAMAFIAGATTRIAVNSSVIVLPYHDPIVLAKAAATLDVLSGGRLMLAFGIGHAEGEFRALGVPYRKRGRMTDEYLEAMNVLWTEDEPSYTGALRRAARFGQGWMPWLVTPEQLPARLDELRQFPEFGSKEGSFDIFMPPVPLNVREEDHRPIPGAPRVDLSSTQAVIDSIGALAGIGVTSTSIIHPGPPAATLDEHLEHLAWGAEEVMPVFR